MAKRREEDRTLKSFDYPRAHKGSSRCAKSSRSLGFYLLISMNNIAGSALTFGAELSVETFFFPHTCARPINTSTAAVEAHANNVLQLMWCENSIFSLLIWLKIMLTEHRTLHKPPRGRVLRLRCYRPSCSGACHGSGKDRYLRTPPLLCPSAAGFFLSGMGWETATCLRPNPRPPIPLYVHTCTAALYEYNVRELM